MSKARCLICGDAEHDFKCPMISAFEYHPDGKSLKRTEFFTIADVVELIAKNLPDRSKMN